MFDGVINWSKEAWAKSDGKDKVIAVMGIIILYLLLTGCAVPAVA